MFRAFREGVRLEEEAAAHNKAITCWSAARPAGDRQVIRLEQRVSQKMKINIMQVAAFAGILLLAGGTANGQAMKPGSYYVAVDVLEERLAPEPNATVTNRIYRQQRVDVYETKNGWARLSRYYDGAIEGKSGQVARWVLAKHLSPARPADKPQPAIASDPRIPQGSIPKVGEDGLSESDVRILHRGAFHFLESGRCKRVEYAHKSVSKPNTYFVNCGGANLFFTPADLPSR